MKRIRISKPRIRSERAGTEDLPADPRDPDVVRAKALARARLTGSRGNRDRKDSDMAPVVEVRELRKSYGDSG